MSIRISKFFTMYYKWCIRHVISDIYNFTVISLVLFHIRIVNSLVKCSIVNDNPLILNTIFGLQWKFYAQQSHCIIWKLLLSGKYFLTTNFWKNWTDEKMKCISEYLVKVLSIKSMFTYSLTVTVDKIIKLGQFAICMMYVNHVWVRLLLRRAHIQQHKQLQIHKIHSMQFLYLYWIIQHVRWK